MDKIWAIEQAIVEQLKSSEIGARIDNDPRNGQASPKALVLVQHEGDMPTGGQPRNCHALNLTFTVEVRATDQRIGSHKNVYPVIEAVRQCLIAFDVGNGSNLAYGGTERQDFPTETGIYWRYMMRFSCHTVWSQEAKTNG